MEIGTEISQKIRSAIKSKLIELSTYVDEELPDYIMVMVANRKDRNEMSNDLCLFLGENTDSFTAWLHGLLERLKSITSDKTVERKDAEKIGNEGPKDEIPACPSKQITTADKSEKKRDGATLGVRSSETAVKKAKLKDPHVKSEKKRKSDGHERVKKTKSGMNVRTEEPTEKTTVESASVPLRKSKSHGVSKYGGKEKRKHSSSPAQTAPVDVDKIATKLGTQEKVKATEDVRKAPLMVPPSVRAKIKKSGGIRSVKPISSDDNENRKTEAQDGTGEHVKQSKHKEKTREDMGEGGQVKKSKRASNERGHSSGKISEDVLAGRAKKLKRSSNEDGHLSNNASKELIDVGQAKKLKLLTNEDGGLSKKIGEEQLEGGQEKKATNLSDDGHAVTQPSVSDTDESDRRLRKPQATVHRSDHSEVMSEKNEALTLEKIDVEGEPAVGYKKGTKGNAVGSKDDVDSKESGNGKIRTKKKKVPTATLR